MSYHEDPDFRQIRLEFLNYIREFHSTYEFTTNWQGICEDLGIIVKSSNTDFHATYQQQTIISINPKDPQNRKDYTGLHELCHHLCKTADEGFRALLEEKYSAKEAYAFEEDLCYEGAGIFLAPDHIIKETLTKYDLQPEAIFYLSSRMGSLAACLLRLVRSVDIDCWGLIMRQDGEVEFSCTNTKYPIWKGHQIEDGHAIHQAWHGWLEAKAAIPYSGGDRKVVRTMRANSREKRVIALFCKKFPSFSNTLQQSLF